MRSATATASSASAAVPHSGQRIPRRSRSAPKRSRSSARSIALADRQHLLDAERLEVEPVGGVVVGRDRLRVAVDDHGLVTKLAKPLRGVDAAVVELDPLPDPDRPRAQDDHTLVLHATSAFVRLTPGGVEVVGLRRNFARTGVDAVVARSDAPGAALRARYLLGRAGGGGDLRVGEPEPLESEPIVGDELVDMWHGTQ